MGAAGRKAHAFGFKKLCHAAGGIQPEGAPTGQKNGVSPVHQMVREACDDLASPGGGAPNVRAADRAPLGHNDGATCQPLEIACVSHTDAGKSLGGIHWERIG